MFNVIPVGAQMDRFLVVGHHYITDIMIHALQSAPNVIDMFVIIISDRVNYHFTGNSG